MTGQFHDISTAALATEFRRRGLQQLADADVPACGLTTADPDLCFAFLEDGRMFLPVGTDQWLVLRDPTEHDGPLCCPAALLAHIMPADAVADLIIQSRRVRAAERRHAV